MVLAASTWNGNTPESAWYEFTLPGNPRNVCRTDGATFLDDLVAELGIRLDAAGSRAVDWNGAVVGRDALPSTDALVWTTDLLRALYAVLRLDGAMTAAAAVRADAARGVISETTLRAAIWETVRIEVRDASGNVLPEVDPSTGARRQVSGSRSDLVRLPPGVVTPVMGIVLERPAVSSGEVCGEPPPGLDIDAVASPASWVEKPIFLIGLAAVALIAASAISQRGAKVSDWDKSRKRRF